MQSRTFTRLMAVLLVGLFSLPAFAQYTRDKAARKKIDEAINQHYLMMELDEAEAVLTGTIEACENKCSPQTLAEAWMYVGIVRGSGRNDQAGAAEAFRNASAIHPAVKLDAALATPETQETFAASGGTQSAGAPPAAAADDDIGDEAIPGDMLCTPEVRQVETRRAIPVSCHTEEAGVKAELKFKAPGGEWKKIAMKKSGDEWRAEIPCDETNVTGTLQWYVQVTDSIDEVVDSLGSRKQPVEMRLMENTSEPPPAFPGQSPPPRCTSSSDCPPDFPGCGETSCGDKDWGVSCNNSSECKCGLLCVDGACETAPSCEMDDDCPSGSCVDGTCAAGPEDFSSSRPSRHWIGVHGALDVLQIGNFSRPCDPDVENQVSCFAFGEPYPSLIGTDNVLERPTVAPRLVSGFAPAQIRALLSYEFMFHDNMSVGVRAGFAFQGAPKDFLPVHAEARFSYYFLGNTGTGFHPYAHAGGGLADVQGLVQKNNVESCRQDGAGQICDTLNIKMYQKSGPIFATVGAGALWNFTPRLGLKINVNAMFLFPDPGTAIQPSLGLVYGL